MNKIKTNYTVLERLSRIISHLEKRLTCAGATSASDCDGSLDAYRSNAVGTCCSCNTFWELEVEPSAAALLACSVAVTAIMAGIL